MMTTRNQGWTTRLDIRVKFNRPRKIALTVHDEHGKRILHSDLPPCPEHPRALLTVLEGLALWSGARLDVVISADAEVSDSLGLGVIGGESWPDHSALVHMVWRGEADRKRCLAIREREIARWAISCKWEKR